MSEEILWRKRRQANTEISLSKRNVDGLDMFWDMTDFCMKLLKAKWEVNQQEGGEEFKFYMIWQWWWLWWLCCTETDSWGERQMETQRKDVKNLLHSRRLHWIEIPHYTTEQMIECSRWFRCNPDPWMFTWFLHCRIGPTNSCLGVGFSVSGCFYLSK